MEGYAQRAHHRRLTPVLRDGNPARKRGDINDLK